MSLSINIFKQVHVVEYPNCIRKITRVPVDFFHLGDELNVRIIDGWKDNYANVFKAKTNIWDNEIDKLFYTVR